MDSTLIEGVLAQKRRYIAKAISHIENNSSDSLEILSKLYPHTGRAYRIGITGPPGAGKSSLTDRLIQYYRENNQTVAVVGIDPTSPFSGGAILGDRIRMGRHYEDKGVYIRSMASRGGHGGLANSTQEVGDVFDAAGFDIILFETVGVGQVELDVIQASDTVVVVLVPESGDDIQMMKAGLMEIADIFAINKSDRQGANKLFISITNMLTTMPHDENTWIPKVIKTTALTNDGVSELSNGIDTHKQHIEKTGMWTEKLSKRYTKQVKTLVSNELNQNFWSDNKIQLLENELNKMHNKRKSPQQLSIELHSGE
jgi:LAO/AO transport system kinase